jgi:hypothetical protein
VQANLLYGVGDVRLSQRQVLQCPGDAAELGGVLNRRPGIYSKLHLEVDRSSVWLAVSHGRMLEDIQCVGVLVEDQPVFMMLNSDAEKMVKRPEDFHSKLPMYNRNSEVHKLRIGSQNDIINIK